MDYVRGELAVASGEDLTPFVDAMGIAMLVTEPPLGHTLTQYYHLAGTSRHLRCIIGRYAPG